MLEVFDYLKDSGFTYYVVSGTAAFMLIADDDERDHANREKALELAKKWHEAGYHVISMRDDFRTIYGPDVVKTDFVYK